MNIIDKIFTYKNKKRAVISDKSEVLQRYDTTRAAKIFAEDFMQELSLVGRVNKLLNSPHIEYSKHQHLKLTLPLTEWLDDSRGLCVLFSIDTGEPVCAYFEEAKECENIGDL